ncbi:MAG: hypothetical protein HN341_18965 [Verrucomicrobia bacterium]|jgi:hypothetical protein|nr:hypothetical protein [Verrucomicrobiota bacterium]
MKTAKILIAVGGAVGAILFLSAGFVLYRGIVRFSTARDDLTVAKRDLARYYEAPIFPSRENVQKELGNVEQVDVWFDELMDTLGEGNVTSGERSPSKFIGVSEVVRRRLVAEGQKAGAELPEPARSFAFGFDRYSGTGELPKPQDVPRLMEQLVIINRLCLVMFNNRIKSISKVERDEFEDSPGPVTEASAPSGSTRGRSRRGSSTQGASSSRASRAKSKLAGVIGEDALFAKLHFVLEFRAKESALVGILNALSLQPMFVAVTSLSVEKATPELVPAVPEVDAEHSDRSGFGGVTEPEVPEENQRLGPNYPVCGIKMEIPMDIRLELDVYKFKEAAVDSGN